MQAPQYISFNFSQNSHFICPQNQDYDPNHHHHGLPQKEDILKWVHRSRASLEFLQLLMVQLAATPFPFNVIITISISIKILMLRD